MNKIREFSRSYIFLSILYVAIGSELVAGPTLSLAMIGRGLGILLIVVGATCGIVYFTGDKKQEGFLQVELVVAIVCAALGVFVLLTQDFMSMILPFAMATVLLVGAIVKIQSAVSMRRLFVRRWYVALIAALVIIGLGVFVLVFPFATDAQMLLYIGICLILDGLTNLSGLFCIQIRTRKLAKIQKNNPGADVKALIEKEWEAADAAKAEKKARKREKKNQKEQEIVSEAEEVTPDVANTASGTSEGTVQEVAVVLSAKGGDTGQTPGEPVGKTDAEQTPEKSAGKDSGVEQTPEESVGKGSDAEQKTEDSSAKGSSAAPVESAGTDRKVQNPLTVRAKAIAASRKKDSAAQEDGAEAGGGSAEKALPDVVK
ncbi:MAG: DUF308 domain-containing protein, partial [Lachnospiraceae bacterium]|nr:DUF308 domain-containing protein [Lachnospiraceae bacterium]